MTCQHSHKARGGRSWETYSLIEFMPKNARNFLLKPLRGRSPPPRAKHGRAEGLSKKYNKVEIIIKWSASTLIKRGAKGPEKHIHFLQVYFSVLLLKSLKRWRTHMQRKVGNRQAPKTSLSYRSGSLRFRVRAIASWQTLDSVISVFPQKVS